MLHPLSQSGPPASQHECLLRYLCHHSGIIEETSPDFYRNHTLTSAETVHTCGAAPWVYTRTRDVLLPCPAARAALSCPCRACLCGKQGLGFCQ